MGNVHMEATQINFRGGASKMNVEEAIKSAIELTPEQKTNINKIPTIEAAVATKTDQTVIAPEFDAEAGTYAIGDMVMHEGKLYEFTSAHETAGDWNAEEVSEKTVSDEIDTLKSGLNNVDSEIQMHVRKDGGRAWPGTTLTFSGIGADTSRAWHFVAIMGNNTGGGSAQEGYIVCPNDTTSVIWNKSGDWTAAYSNNTLTITLPYSTYWVYRLERAATMNG